MSSLPSPSRPETLYGALEALPEGVNGEIIAGQLYAFPRPAARHGLAASSLDGDLFNPFSRGRGGPGGWWITVEPEVHFVHDVELCVPDLAGWHRDRMPELPEDHRFPIVPDWVCEILSPSTASHDRETKMPLYARYGVGGTPGWWTRRRGDWRHSNSSTVRGATSARSRAMHRSASRRSTRSRSNRHGRCDAGMVAPAERISFDRALGQREAERGCPYRYLPLW